MYAEYNMRHSTQADLRAWRTPEWKFVRDLRRPGSEELYDLRRDPGETANLIHSSETAARRARADLQRKLDGFRYAQ
jgi:arylsulfatase A-like enzyme